MRAIIFDLEQGVQIATLTFVLFACGAGHVAARTMVLHVMTGAIALLVPTAPPAADAPSSEELGFGGGNLLPQLSLTFVQCTFDDVQHFHNGVTISLLLQIR